MEPAGLYIHVPFCRGKCPYCDFFSVCAPRRVPAFLADLRAEIELVRDAMGTFDTLYIGGGSPSALAPAELAALLSMARDALSSRTAGPLELTVELNPADVGPELLDVLRRAGVNRLSLGVQSFDDRALRLLGRRHDAAGALAAVEAIRAAGFDNLGLDLIHDLPGMHPGGWRRTLERAVSLRPEHLSCYALTIADRTPFGRMRARGALELPDEEECAEMFRLSGAILEEAGYDHYEVSNFARVPGLRARHNRKYWRRIPTLGLGPGAHGFDGVRRTWNLADLDAYHRALAAGRRPLEGAEDITPAQARLETIALGMRTAEGVRLDAVQPADPETVDGLIAERVVYLERGRLRPTRRGYPVADAIAARLA